MNGQYAALIEAFARDVGLDLAGEVPSPADITIDGERITLAYDDRTQGDDLVMYASLGIVPQESELAVYRGLLEGNLLWSATADATIGVNSQTREAMIAYKRPIAGMTAETLANAVILFVELAKQWRAFVQGEAAGSASAAGDGARAFAERA